MDFGGQRGFLLEGEDPPEKVGCRKESYFLEFKYVDVARDFVGVVFHVLLDGAKGSHNHPDCSSCFEPPNTLYLDILKLFRGFDWGAGVEGYSHVSEKSGFILLVL